MVCKLNIENDSSTLATIISERLTQNGVKNTALFYHPSTNSSGIAVVDNGGVDEVEVAINDVIENLKTLRENLLCLCPSYDSESGSSAYLKSNVPNRPQVEISS
jgi:hypothetical protein